MAHCLLACLSTRPGLGGLDPCPPLHWYECGVRAGFGGSWGWLLVGLLFGRGGLPCLVGASSFLVLER